jgi:hypothetical protein
LRVPDTGMSETMELLKEIRSLLRIKICQDELKAISPYAGTPVYAGLDFIIENCHDLEHLNIVGVSESWNRVLKNIALAAYQDMQTHGLFKTTETENAKTTSQSVET